MWIQRIILLSFLLLFFGCAIKDKQPNKKIITPTQRISTNSGLISIMAPLNKNIGVYYAIGKTTEYIGLFWGIKDTMVCKFLISTEMYDIFDSDKYLIPKNFEIFEKESKIKKTFYNKTFGITYKKAYVDYIDGVKCRTFALDRKIYPYKINNEPTYTKKYETYCSLYKKDEKPIVVRLEYEYNYNFASAGFINSNKTKKETLNDIENIFRQDMQAIFSTIKLGIDREKMKKEGLLFDKPYKVQF